MMIRLEHAFDKEQFAAVLAAFERWNATGYCAAVNRIERSQEVMLAQLETLVEEVAALKTVEESAVAAINGLEASLDEVRAQLAAEIEAGNPDLTPLDGAISDLREIKSKLAAAISTAPTESAPVEEPIA